MFAFKHVKIIVAIIISIMVIISSFLIYNIIILLKYKEGSPKDIIYVDNIQSSNNYDVFLKPNDFISDQPINKDLSYISALVDHISTNYYYEYIGNNSALINYVYRIKANIISDYINEGVNNVSKPIWNKEFTLLNSKSGSTNNSNVKISEKLDIDLNYFNNLVESFRNSLILPINSKLEVKFIVNIAVKLPDNKELKKEHYILMTIPLGVKAFDITTAKNFTDREITYNKEPKGAKVNYMMAIIYIVIELLVLGVTYYLIRQIVDKKKNKYYEEIRKILKDYDERIVTVSNFIKFNKLEIVDLPNFEELLNLSNETLEPIIYWQRRERGINEAWFSILRNRILYRYVTTYKPDIINNNKQDCQS